MKTLYIECAMGAAGDMLTAALLAQNGVRIWGESQARQALTEWGAFAPAGEA